MNSLNYALQMVNFMLYMFCHNKNGVEVKEQRKRYHANTNQKKLEVTLNFNKLKFINFK